MKADCPVDDVAFFSELLMFLVCFYIPTLGDPGAACITCPLVSDRLCFAEEMWYTC